MVALLVDVPLCLESAHQVRPRRRGERDAWQFEYSGLAPSLRFPFYQRYTSTVSEHTGKAPKSAPYGEMSLAIPAPISAIIADWRKRAEDVALQVVIDLSEGLHELPWEAMLALAQAEGFADAASTLTSAEADGAPRFRQRLCCRFAFAA